MAEVVSTGRLLRGSGDVSVGVGVCAHEIVHCTLSLLTIRKFPSRVFFSHSSLFSACIFCVLDCTLSPHMFARLHPLLQLRYSSPSLLSLLTLRSTDTYSVASISHARSFLIFSFTAEHYVYMGHRASYNTNTSHQFKLHFASVSKMFTPRLLSRIASSMKVFGITSLAACAHFSGSQTHSYSFVF